MQTIVLGAIEAIRDIPNTVYCLSTLSYKSLFKASHPCPYNNCLGHGPAAAKS